MKRRNTFRFFGLIVLSPISRWLNAGVRKPEDSLEFYISGARFYRAATQTLKIGDKVTLRAERFEDSIAYAIYSPTDQKIGYAPASEIKNLQQKEQHTGLVIKANHFALPWKQFQIRL